MEENKQLSYFDSGKSGGIPDFMLRNKEIYTRYAEAFQRVFGTRLWNFWDMRFGFDVVKFDEQLIKSEDGESCAEVVERDYGKPALDLIYKLIDKQEKE